MPEVPLYQKFFLVLTALTLTAVYLRFVWKRDVETNLAARRPIRWEELSEDKREELSLMQRQQGSLLHSLLADAARMNPERLSVERTKQPPPRSHILDVRTIDGQLLLRIDVNFSRALHSRFAVTWEEDCREEFYADLLSGDPEGGKSPAIQICEFVKNYSEAQLPESA